MGERYEGWKGVIMVILDLNYIFVGELLDKDKIRNNFLFHVYYVYENKLIVLSKEQYYIRSYHELAK